MKNHFATYISCLGMAVSAMSITMLSPLLNQISMRFGLSVGQSGLLITINFLGFALFNLAGGGISEKIGKKRILNISLIGLAVCALSLSLVNNFIIVLILMLFYGGCGGAFETFVTAMIADMNPENTVYYINMSQVFFGIGAVIAPVAVGTALQLGVNYRWCYVVLGLLALLCGLIFIRISVPAFSSEQGITFTDIKKLLKNKFFYITCFCMLCYTGAEVGTWGWMGTFLGGNFHFTPLQASLGLASFWVAMTLGRFLCGRLSRNFSVIRMTIILSASAVAAAIWLSNVRGSMFFAVSFVLGLACSSQLPFIMAFGERYVSRAKNTAFALFMISSNIGSITIPYMIGRVSEISGVRSAMLVPAIFFSFVAVSFGILGIWEKRKI